MFTQGFRSKIALQLWRSNSNVEKMSSAAITVRHFTLTETKKASELERKTFSKHKEHTFKFTVTSASLPNLIILFISVTALPAVGAEYD